MSHSERKIPPVSWHVHVCREAGVISWLIIAFRITIIPAAACRFCCFLPRSSLLCASAALMCRTWGFYRVLNIAPQGSRNPDSISNYATESRVRESERDAGMWGKMATDYQRAESICLPLPIFAIKPREPMERRTQTRPRVPTKEHYVLQTSRYPSSPQAKLFRFPYAAAALLRFQRLQGWKVSTDTQHLVAFVVLWALVVPLQSAYSIANK